MSTQAPPLKPVGIAVIGAGAMGRNHARVLADLDGVQLVAVVDTQEISAKRVAHKHRAVALTNYEDLFRRSDVDAVVVAVPSREHARIAKACLEHRLHVLVEKPLAATTDEGRELVAASESAQTILMVGHIERFNPAITALKREIASDALGQLFQIDVRRQGPFPTRIMDVGVAVDLAVHDADIVRYITSADVKRVFAEAESRVRGGHEDSLYALLRLDNGVMANLSVNWLTPTKIRTLCVTGERGMFVVDYLTQDLFFYENQSAPDHLSAPLGVLRGVAEGNMIRHRVDKGEPLRAELEAFVNAVRTRSASPVSARDALSALCITEALLASARSGKTTIPEPVDLRVDSPTVANEATRLRVAS